MIFFTTNVRYLRNNSKKTVAEIANDLGVGKSAFSAYENGNAVPKLQTLVKMTELFNVSLDDLVLKDLTQNSKPPTSLIIDKILISNKETDLVSTLKKRIEDKDEMIALLKEQIDFYKKNSK